MLTDIYSYLFVFQTLVSAFTLFGMTAELEIIAHTKDKTTQTHKRKNRKEHNLCLEGKLSYPREKKAKNIFELASAQRPKLQMCRLM